MNKIFLILVFSITFILSSCKKDEVLPVSLISADSAKAKELNITTAQYLQIKGILNSMANQTIQDNNHITHNPFDPFRKK